MSEDTNLTPNGGAVPDVERDLRSLSPQPLEIDRDELFFQAGYAAGTRSSTASGYLWLSAAAALLLTCIGLGVALARQNNALQIAQAAVQRGPEQTVAESEAVTKPQAEFDAPGPQRLLAGAQMRRLRQLASLDPLPPGQLTAMGWVRSAEVGNGEWGMGSEGQNPREPAAAPQSLPPRPSTYFELMRAYREG